MERLREIAMYGDDDQFVDVFDDMDEMYPREDDRYDDGKDVY